LGGGTAVFPGNALPEMAQPAMKMAATWLFFFERRHGGRQCGWGHA
jgi:hypothetical protein